MHFNKSRRVDICSLFRRGGYPWSSVRILGRTELSTQESPVRIPLYRYVGKICGFLRRIYYIPVFYAIVVSTVKILLFILVGYFNTQYIQLRLVDDIW